MYVNITVLKETQTHQRRVALVPGLVPKIVQLGGRLPYGKRGRERHRPSRHCLCRGCDCRGSGGAGWRRRCGARGPDRGEEKGYAGIVNSRVEGDNCNMVYGDAQAVLAKMIEAVRGLGLSVAA
ncbi:hypothetical protein [Sphingobium sp. D43FB]|uniref:hypothetical protein n=1 Tax=Sphingobium sp. D43FB TaxID=2017595 RepID=UPI000BB576DA|nr:hypothetical protein [Sphingobium sp. D43FB]PBN43584.1 hypothetical protein SxD43FB_10795 [Sphingobium sp. D43FB]